MKVKNSIFLMNITISDSYNDFSCLKFGIFVETVTLAPSQITDFDKFSYGNTCGSMIQFIVK